METVASEPWKNFPASPDLEITIGDSIIKCHIVMLQFKSPVFRSMFDVNMVEKNTNKLTIDDIDEKTFLIFLSYLYAPQQFIREMIEQHLTMELLYAAKKYKVHTLLEVFNYYSEFFVKVDNAIECAIAASQNCPSWSAKLVNFIADNYKLIQKRENFGLLKREVDFMIALYDKLDVPKNSNSKRTSKFRDSEITFRFSVENISLLKDAQYSPPCYVQNLPWRMSVSYDQNQKNEKALGLYLNCSGKSKSTSWSCYATGELRLLSCREGQKPLCQTFQALFSFRTSSWGFHKFINWVDLVDPEKGFIEDDSITLEVYVKANTPQDVGSKCSIISGIDHIKNFPASTDLEITIGDSIIKCHKVMLQFKSPVFRSMFDVNMVEKNTNKLTIDDIDEKTFLIFLSYLYAPEQFILEINEEDLTMELLYAANKYMVHTILEVFNYYSNTFVKVDNVIECAIVASQNCPSWSAKLVNFIANNYKLIQKRENFGLLKREVDFMTALFDKLSVNSNSELSCKFRGSEVTFRFSVDNISLLRGVIERRISLPCYVQNLPWRMSVMHGQNYKINEYTLAFALECHFRTTSWSCYATGELRLLSCREGQKPLCKTFQQAFSNIAYRTMTSLNWRELVDPKNGYIKDDSITLEVYLKVDTSKGV